MADKGRLAITSFMVRGGYRDKSRLARRSQYVEHATDATFDLRDGKTDAKWVDHTSPPAHSPLTGRLKEESTGMQIAPVSV